MSDRGSVEAHERQVRVIAAIALLTAAGAMGFFAGRMSAPVVQTETAAVIRGVARAAPIQPQPQSDPPVAPRQEPDPSHNSVASSIPKANLVPIAAPKEVASPEQKEAGPNVTVINRGWDRAQPAVSQAAPEPEVEVPASDEAPAFGKLEITKCERRFNSFRVSDGTFQPYGGSSRELCPFLR